MNFQYDFTEKQKLLRKAWLILTIMMYFVFTPFRMGYLTLNFAPAGDKGLIFILSMISLFAFFSTLYFCILYRCAYKKPGTRILTVVLILAALGILRELGSLSKSPSLLDFCFSFVALLMSSWWCVLSYGLRKINHEIKALKRAAVEAQDLKQ